MVANQRVILFYVFVMDEVHGKKRFYDLTKLLDRIKRKLLPNGQNFLKKRYRSHYERF